MGVNFYKGEIILLYLGKCLFINIEKILVLMKYVKFYMINEIFYM